jgi:hypothetical protein
MNAKSLILISFLALGSVAYAQTDNPGPKQDMHNAGTDTKHAATNAGHGVSQGTQKAYHKTVSGTKTGYHKSVKGTKTGYHKTTTATKNVGRRVEGKPTTPNP